ncbi:glycoside hydrolase family 65 protein [Microbacterium hydrocarbonoxydans]|uniref:Alpha,alpha-trehalose phosphorylase n=1 Tax=Microbacterium hydrocarbonoxydans TaxID=273678 RepID=A0A1H4JK90_9MICO|nr:glycosyl hydrolase family 65 protein [Microbacterium hydrocarbonoxydans]SEB46731.1 alpha,alpha-trehalose phosphorylase [Microbacterium hydrocarbonoxydans]
MVESGQHGFDVEEWSVGSEGVDTEHLAHEESVFGLSNGHVGWRGNLDEGDPRGVAGSYLNGVFEEHPMPYAEEGYGYPEHGQSVINVSNGQLIRLLVGDEAFDVRRGTLDSHSRRLDLRAGTLQRDLGWTSPVGTRVRVRSTRIVSFAHRSVAAVRYIVEAIDATEVTIVSELLANEPLPITHEDPRVQELLKEPWEAVHSTAQGAAATLVHRTRKSGLSVAVSMDHRVAHSGRVTPEVATDVDPAGDRARTTVHVALEAGETIEVVKLVGHEWSSTLSTATLRDRAETAVADAFRGGWETIADEQRSRLDEFWECADVRIDGPQRLQQAVRFALFQVFQASVRMELRSVPGKGLTGSGYEGHTFWDFEAFVLPVLTSTLPHAAEQALRWRHSVLDHARDRATQLHLRGAALPWRTIDGREASGYWPASTAAFHINADVAGAVLHYVRATGDEAFEREAGVELLAESARLWMSLGRWDARGGFHLDGVTGPDEYSAIANDNVFTNLSAQLNLRGAAAAARRHPEVAEALSVTADEIAGWEDAAEAMTVPFDAERSIHPQSAGYTDLEIWDFEATSPDQYLLQNHFPYFDLYRKQVVKQADLVLALWFAHEAFTPEQKSRAFSYYEALTVRDSSLSAAAQSVIAAEVGHLDLALDYLAEVATLDLDDLHGNTGEGLHVAALAGVWTAITAGFGGMRDGETGLRFRPRLPAQVHGLEFGVRIHGCILRVEITPASTTYRLASGAPVTITHFDEEVVLEPGHPVTLDTPPLGPPGPRPTQPHGRAPRPAAEAFGRN